MKKKTMIKITSNNFGVSETIGSLLMIVLAVSTFSMISLVVLNPWVNFQGDEQTFTTIVGSVVGKDILLHHRGGLPLAPETMITITIDSGSPTIIKKTVSELNMGEDWKVGEYVKYNDESIDVLVFVQVVITDVSKNIILFDKVLQDGIPDDTPYVMVYTPVEESVSETGATLKMYYDFAKSEYFDSLDKGLSFFIFPKGASPDEHYEIVITSEVGIRGTILCSPPDVPVLTKGTCYEYYAKIYYTEDETEKFFKSNVASFWTYDDTRAEYTFEADEAEGMIIVDSIRPEQNGTVSGSIEHVEGYDSGTALQFDSSTDYVYIPYHNKFNVTLPLSIDMDFKTSSGGEVFFGDVSYEDNEKFSVLLNEFSIETPCYEPDLIEIDAENNIYAFVYQDFGSAYVATISITDQGDIGGIIDWMNLDMRYFAEPTIFHISDSVYGIVCGMYLHSMDVGVLLITINIDNDGSIGYGHDQIIDYEFLSQGVYLGSEPSVVYLFDDIYVFSFGGAFGYGVSAGYLVTVHIPNNGDNIEIEQSYPFKQNYKLESEIFQVSYDIIGVIYSYSNNPTFFNTICIRSVQITSDGKIIMLDIFTFTTNYCLEPSVIKLYEGAIVNNFAVVYGGGSDPVRKTGWIHTFQIKSDGMISKNLLDSYMFSIPNWYEADIIHVIDDLYAISYSAQPSAPQGSGCYLMTVRISDIGQIFNRIIDNFEFTSLDIVGYESCMNKIFTDEEFCIIGVCYSGQYGAASDAGFLATVRIDSTGEINVILMKEGCYFVETDGLNVITTFWIETATGIQDVSLSLLLSEDWNQFSVQFSGSSLILMLNEQYSLYPVTGEIVRNNNPIIFGPFFGCLDDVVIKSV